MNSKVCSKCKRKLPKSEFFKTGFTYLGKQKYRADCKQCSQARHKAYVRGLSVKEREDFLASRDFRCEVCGMSRDASLRILKKDLSIDHCHITNVNKGVLCNVCNMGSGYFRDDSDLAFKLFKYLERTRKDSKIHTKKG